MLGFFEAVDKHKNEESFSILLGNGFSISLHEKFSYPSLIEVLKKPQKDFADDTALKVAQILSATNTVDVEDSIRALMISKKILPLYENEGKILAKRIGTDIDELRHALAKAITSRHPRRKWDYKPVQYADCAKKLSYFSSVFTINYDLLLEWVCLPTQDYNGAFREFNDGFRFFYRAEHGFFKRYKPDRLPYTKEGIPGRERFRNKDRGSKKNLQNIFYLHGALHFHMNQAELIKYLPVKDDNDMFFIDVCEEFINAKQFPHVVIEGDPEDKLKAIDRSPYLRACFEAMLSSKGTLCVYGCNLHSHDDHIAHAIVKSHVEKLVYGYRFELHSDAEGQIVKGNVNKWAEQREELRSRNTKIPPLEIVFCDTTHSNFWDSDRIC